MSRRGAAATSAVLLGPVFCRFLLRLHAAQGAYDPQDTAVLFLARGGIRIRLLYEEFLARNKITAPIEHADFYVSRMSLIKANLLKNYEAVYEDLAKEYAHTPVGEFVRQFLGDGFHSRWSASADPSLAARTLDLATLQEVVWGQDDAADLVRRALLEQAELYGEYLDATVGGRRRVIVVDTGWSGSILHYLQTYDPGRDYTALYFGRHSYGRPTPPWYPRVIGLAVEAERFSARRPETALLAYRHLIEGACEIRMPSVTGYRRTAAGTAGPVEGPATSQQVLPGPDEPQAEGILWYVRRAPHGLSVSGTERAAHKALRALWWRVVYPSGADVSRLTIPTRSADFGKDLDVPVLVPRVRGPRPRRKWANVRNSLWPAGQVAVEFPVTRLAGQAYLLHGDTPRRLRAKANAVVTRRRGRY